MTSIIPSKGAVTPSRIMLTETAPEMVLHPSRRHVAEEGS
jgi:hypothetical protein